jgi:hypothetical protein
MANRNAWNEEIRQMLGSPFRLRFELGGELSNLPRFIQAFDRARSLAEAVFTNSRLIAVVGVSVNDDEGHRPKNERVRALKAVGFDAPLVSKWRAPRHQGEGACWWKCFDIGTDRLVRDTLLWCSTSIDMAIAPKVPVTIYLIDPARSIILNAYDDRGMDVCAILRNNLIDTYVAFDKWLLDYDRPRMAEAFELGSE